MIETSLLPSHRVGVRLIQDRKGAALIGPGDSASTAINETALALWELCDGETSIDEMIDAVATLFGSPRDVIAQDVVQAITDLVHLGKVSVMRPHPPPLVSQKEGRGAATGATG